ncbi:hypothetical protein PIROE2DRAFT_7135, partial [Piromyces sp. E2]
MNQVIVDIVMLSFSQQINLSYRKDEPIEDSEDNEIVISTLGRCGENRWCGKSDEYCDISKGCQSEFGKCNDKSTSNKDEKDEKEKDSKDNENKEKEDNKKLNISSSEASKVYFYTDKRDKGHKQVINNYFKNKLSKEVCSNECKKVKTELESTIKSDNISIIEEYSKKFFGEYFLSDCEIYYGLFDETEPNKIIDDGNESESKSELINLVKRYDYSCDPVDQANLVLVYYKNGYPYYQEMEGSAPTAASFVNGCGPQDPDNFKGKLNYVIQNKGKEHAALFEPACNAHDLCYSCSLVKSDKEKCERYFYENLIDACIKKYPDAEEFAGRDIPTIIEIYKYRYDYVKNEFYISGNGDDAFDKRLFDPSRNCTRCGLPLVYNTLIHTPYYIKDGWYPKIQTPDDSKCTNLGGQCMNSNNCDGTVENDLCPGNENNKCCLPMKECKYDGLTGVCKNVNDCDGFSQPDLCDGGKDNQCCIP